MIGQKPARWSAQGFSPPNRLVIVRMNRLRDGAPLLNPTADIAVRVRTRHKFSSSTGGDTESCWECCRHASVIGTRVRYGPTDHSELGVPPAFWARKNKRAPPQHRPSHSPFLGYQEEPYS